MAFSPLNIEYVILHVDITFMSILPGTDCRPWASWIWRAGLRAPPRHRWRHHHDTVSRHLHQSHARMVGCGLLFNTSQGFGVLLMCHSGLHRWHGDKITVYSITYCLVSHSCRRAYNLKVIICSLISRSNPLHEWWMEGKSRPEQALGILSFNNIHIIVLSWHPRSEKLDPVWEAWIPGP